MLLETHVSGIELVMHGLEKRPDAGYLPVYNDKIVLHDLSVDQPRGPFR